MKLFLRIGVIFLLAVAVAGFSYFNSGQVSLYFASYQIECSVNLLALLWLISLGIFYYLVRLYVNLRYLPQRFINSRQTKLATELHRSLNLAQLEFFAQHYLPCYKSANRVLKKKATREQRFIAALLAYQAVNQLKRQGDIERILAILNEFEGEPWQTSKQLILSASTSSAPLVVTK